HRTLLLEATAPRERALVRGLQRMLKVSATSVYRQPPPRDPAPANEPSLGDWAARFAPAIAPFVQGLGPGTSGAEAPTPMAASPGARVAAERARTSAPQKKASRAWQAALAVFLTAAVGGVVFAVLQAEPGGRGGAAPRSPSFWSSSP